VKDGSKTAAPKEIPIINNHAPSVDVHMGRLLDNPHFRERPLTHKSIEHRDPMAVFEAAVAKGMMTLDSAAHCLLAKKKSIELSSAVNVGDAMRESGAGKTVLKWLISSGHANNTEFLRHRNRAFCGIFMQFLIHEGLEEICWTWTRRSLKDAPHLLNLPQRSTERREILWDMTTPLNGFVLGQPLFKRESLDAAYSAMIKAVGYVPGLSLSQTREVFGGTICKLVGITKTPSNDRPKATESIFDAFLRLLPASRKTFEYDLAHLRLLHPTRPSADDALRILRDVHIHGLRYPLLRSDVSEVKREEFEMRVLYLGLSAAQFLLDHRQYAEAQEVMDCLRLHFPSQLGLTPDLMKRVEAEEAEAATLQMLDRLSVA